jgi:hypothetical protein
MVAVSRVDGLRTPQMDGRFAALARQTHDSWSLIRLERTPSERMQSLLTLNRLQC